MPVNIITSAAPSFAYVPAGGSVLNDVSIPSGVSAVPGIRPSKVEYAQKHILVGQFDNNITFIEANNTLVKTGIAAPASVPTLAAGAAGNPTGVMLGYISFRHKIGSTVVLESSLSAATASLTVTSQKVEWSSIPATSPDARATHVVLYRSVDGADPREVVELALGTTTYSDNIATSALGGVGLTNNGVPPRARFVAKYHDRVWYVSWSFPARIYYSEIGQPEAVGTSSYITTKDGETITGAQRVLDQLGVPCYRCFYDIQGYSAADFVMRKVHPTTGCIAGHALLNIDERLFFPAEDGVWIFDGAGFTYAMDDLRSYWRDDYLANTALYNDMTAENKKSKHQYRILLKKSTSPKSFYYKGHYLGIDQGKPIRWTFDVRAREDNAIGSMDMGAGLLKSFTGSCVDGFIREEDVATEDDDDGDSYAKAMTLTLKTDLFEDIGGGSLQGKTFTDLNVYLRSESTPWGLSLYGGEEDAADALTPSLGPITIPASALSSLGQTFIGKSGHYFRLLGVTGDALAPKITATSPVGLKFRGWDVYWRGGPGTRRRQT